MVNFGGGNNKKKKTSTANDAVVVGGTPNSSPSKASKNVTPKNGGFFRKALSGGGGSTPVRNDPAVSGPTTPTTPATAPIRTPDSSSMSKIKERPTVDTIDIPLSSQIPSTPDHNTTAALRDGASLLDSRPDDMYRIDSVLSDLSGSIIHTVPTGQNDDDADMRGAAGIAAADPPAYILRTSSIEAMSGSSGNYNSNSAKDSTNTTPVAALYAPTTAESIVTKVLGIVDMSCVSSGLVPSTPTRTTVAAISPNMDSHLKDTTTLKPAYSFQPEWGLSPEDEDATAPGPNSLGSGGSNPSTDSHNNSNINGSTPNCNSNNGIAIKRELAEIAARAAAPSTLQYDVTGEETNISSKQQYRRYHETFELVYTEPTGKKNKKRNGTKATPEATSVPAFASNSKTSTTSPNSQSSKGLRINRWVTKKWNAKKEKQPPQSTLPKIVDSSVTPVPVQPAVQKSATLGIVSQSDIVAQNERSTPKLILEPDMFSPRGSNKKSTASVTAETTTTSTSLSTPLMDSSCDNASSTVVENIETTKGMGVGGRNNHNTTVVVMTTTSGSSVNVTTFPDESKVKEISATGSNKIWYRFNTNKASTAKAKKEKKLVGFDSTIGVGPKFNNRTSPVKKKRFNSKGVADNNKSSDFESQASNPTKIVLKSIKSSTMGLETVAEEDYVDDHTELKVRVPGFHNEDSYLSDHDLIGSEIVEEIYSELNKSIEHEELEQKEQDLSQLDEEPIVKKIQVLEQNVNETFPIITNNPTLLPSTPVKITNDGYQECYDVTAAVVSSTTAHPKSKSWKERLGLKKGEVDGGVHVNVGTVNKTTQNAELAKSEDGPINKKKSKPQWKAVLDPETGKTYYYHRKTRETSWTKPFDWDLAAQRETTTAIAGKVVEDEDEIDRAMQSNALPLPVSTPAAVVLDTAVDLPLEDKTEDVDRIMSDITVPDDTNAVVTHEAFEEDDDDEDEFPQPRHQDLIESTPFDEPLCETNYPDDERKKGDEKSMTTARTRTTTSIYSGFSSRFSHKSRISEVTQPIKNLSSNKPKADLSHASISTKHDSLPVTRQSTLRNRRPTRIPKNIPVPRLRELNVEEFTTRDRDCKARTPRIPNKSHRGEESDGAHPIYAMSGNNTNEIGDTEDADADKSTVSYAATDSISALSEADLSFVDRKEAYDDARRRAFDRAIAQEDWDLAAKLSESMRKTIKTTNNGTTGRSFPQEWVQSEMDRFISENDWDAVAAYVAQVRAHANEASQKQMKHHLATNYRKTEAVTSGQVMVGRVAGGVSRNLQSNSSDVSGTSNPQKIFGARSQLQHGDLHSVDSHSSYSTTFDSEYTSESYEQRSEEKRPPAPINRPRQQEFAC